MKLDTKMTTEGNCRGSKEDHNRGNEKEDAKSNGMRMSQKQFDRERAEINFRLKLLMEMLQRGKVDQRCGWSMKRKITWHRLQVMWEHRKNVQLKEDLTCEPEIGPLLSESNDET